MTDTNNTGGAMNLTIGFQLWFHDPTFAHHVRPRACFILGPGSDVRRVNLGVFPDPVLDAGKVPISQRRNIPVLSAYPETWPAEAFAVVPQLAMQQLEENQGAPHGGIRPLPVCGRVTFVQGFANPAPASPPVTSTPIKVEEPNVDPLNRYTGPPRLIRADGTVQEIAPVTEPPTPAASQKPIGPVMARLLHAPPFQRALEGIEHKVFANGDEFTLQTAKGVDVVKFSHNGQGFTMATLGKTGQWVQVAEGIARPPAVTEAGNRAAKLLQEAGKPATPPKTPKAPKAPKASTPPAKGPKSPKAPKTK